MAAAGVSDLPSEQIADTPKVVHHPYVHPHGYGRYYGGYYGDEYDDLGQVVGGFVGGAVGGLIQAMIQPPVAPGAPPPPPPNVRYTIMLDRGPVISVAQYQVVPGLGATPRYDLHHAQADHGESFSVSELPKTALSVGSDSEQLAFYPTGPRIKSFSLCSSIILFFSVRKWVNRCNRRNGRKSSGTVNTAMPVFPISVNTSSKKCSRDQ